MRVSSLSFHGQGNEGPENLRPKSKITQDGRRKPGTIPALRSKVISKLWKKGTAALTKQASFMMASDHIKVEAEILLALGNKVLFVLVVGGASEVLRDLGC